jgi:hypothetical protein
MNDAQNITPPPRMKYTKRDWTVCNGLFVGFLHHVVDEYSDILEKYTVYNIKVTF